MTIIINYSIDLVGVDSDKALKHVEAEVIEHTHQLSKYNQSRTAKNLGISRGCLRMKLAEYFPGKYL